MGTSAKEHSMIKPIVKLSLVSFLLITPLFGCNMIQEQTNREAPNQVQQKEGRKEVKMNNQEREKKSEEKEQEK